MSRLAGNLLIFGRVLRRAGFHVHSGRLAELIDALGCVNLNARDDVYHTCRALLVQRQDQIAIFDVAFTAFWRRHRDESPARRVREQSVEPLASVVHAEELLVPEALDGAPGSDGTPGDRAADEGDAAGLPERHLKTWSDRSALARKDFATLTTDELAEARAALSRLVWQPGTRRTRRWIRGRGARIDLRRAIAESLRSGGDVVKLPRRTRRVRRRPLVLLCDVSGSMERYSRMLLHFAHAVTQRHQRVETFVFSTRLTRVTRELRAAGPAEALASVSGAVADWSGGTRIGEVMKEFHQRWSRRVLHGGPVALLISDGWDRGDPVELGDQIARLQRSCHRLIWLNPLIGTADYAPLTRGLQAALPFVDDFLPVRTLTNLAQLAIHLNALA
ncbi:MAG TPA: VWA domain-containing protein [Vicinamibacterales bacterium]|nr:VWA domain-containing protein [Vicinamibacterales bacterium]